MRSLLAIALALTLLAQTGGAEASIVIYDNTVNSTDFPYLAIADVGGGDFQRVPSVDDLQVTGGGLLEEITFAAIADSLGGAVDAAITLALDNGDGIPDFGPGSFESDAILLQKTIAGVNGPGGFIPTGNALLVTVDVTADAVNIPADATVWAQVGYTRFGFAADVGQAFFGPVATGSTDPFVYKATPTGIVGEMPDGDGFEGLGWKLTVVPEPAAASLFALAGVIAMRRRRRH